MNNQPIYLDYNATTPVDDRVVEVMLPYFNQKFGNASSIHHAYGWDAEEAVDIAREQVAGLIGAKSQEIVFTSGATEAINLALLGVFEARRDSKNQIITCETEHKAVLDTCKHLESLGAEVTFLGVDGNGLINVEELKEKLSEQTLMICIMLANNETGVIQPMKKIVALAQQKNVPVFTDATQAVGKIPFNVSELNVDLAAFSSHKLYGPKGVGGLYINAKSNLDIQPQIFGGGHERGVRSGTLNVPGIVGFGKACELAGEIMNDETERLSSLRDAIEKELRSLGNLNVNGQKVFRLPHVTNISFNDVDGSKLMRSLKGLAVSQGSACNSSVVEPSHVLKAMGLSDSLAYASLRISLGRFTTKDEIQKAVKIIRSSVDQLRMQLL